MNNYKTLFDIRIFHNYYTTGICPDLDIIPTNTCRSVLKGHRMLAKNTLNGIRIVTPVTEDDQTKIPLDSELKFTFNLRLKNKVFKNFTGLDAGLNKNAIYFFTNQSDNTSDLSETIEGQSNAGEFNVYTKDFDYSSDTLEVATPAAEEVFVIERNPSGQTTKEDFIIQGLDESASVLAYNPQNNTIKINTAGKEEGTCFQVKYPIPLRTEPGLFGKIEILNNNSLVSAPANTTHFDISFQSKKVMWKYYIVTRNGANFSVIDESENGNLLVFNDEIPNANDAAYQKIKSKYPEPENKILLFKTNGLVALKDKGRGNIQLKKDGNHFIENLPNPSVHDNGIKIIKTN